MAGVQTIESDCRHKTEQAMNPQAEDDRWGQNGEDDLLDRLFETGAADPRATAQSDAEDVWNVHIIFQRHSFNEFYIHFLRRSTHCLGVWAVNAANNNGIEAPLPGQGTTRAQRIDRALALWRADHNIPPTFPYLDFIELLSHHDETAQPRAGGLFRGVINMIQQLQLEIDRLHDAIESLQTHGQTD
jgi:hypothetical protein